MPTRSSGELLDAGMVGDASALATVTDFMSSFYGGRVLEVRLAGGLTFEVLADRGLDLGALWWRGNPVAWRSPMAGVVTDTDRRESSWADRWRGGMMTTCGPDNIGAPRDGYGQHGSHHAIPAEDVAYRRERRDDRLTIIVTGRIRSVALFGRRVTIEREITASTDSGEISVRDTVTNVGNVDTAIPLLYHLNFGAPFLADDTVIRFDGAGVHAREEPPAGVRHDRMPAPVPSMDETVFEHVLAPGSQPDRVAVLETPSRAVRATVTWSAITLPRAFEWLWPARGSWALAIEPANAPMWGPDRAGAAGGAPVLSPGDHFETNMVIALTELGT
jgi:hypothetical protein